MLVQDYLYTKLLISVVHDGIPVTKPSCCSTMGVGRQSRRVCFGAKPDKGFLDKKISPYPEVVRGRERELTTRPRERQLVAGPRRESWWLDRREGSCGRRPRRAVETGQERGEQQRGWRGSTEGQATPDTGTERRGDKIGSSEEESQDV